MNLSLSLAAFTVSLVLSGCAAPPPEVPLAPPPPVFAPGECDAQAAQDLVGQSINTPLAEDARQRSRAERVRVVRPGEVVTMEFDARRLTIWVGDDAKVARASCS